MPSKISIRKTCGEKGTCDETFFSGVGSRGQAANAYVEKISDELNRIACEKRSNIVVVDLGCGDFSIGHALVERIPGISYVGCDIVPEIISHHEKQYANDLVRFEQIDIVADPLPQGDVCLIRQVLQHLPNDDVKQVLAKCEQYPVVFVTEGHPLIIEGPPNPDKPVGPDVRFNYQAGIGRGLQLDQQPFGLATREILRVMASDTEYVSTVEITPGATVRPIRPG
jgi:SAM-dependent methyltransferase